MRYIKNILFLSLFFLCNLQGATIIFDLGNVIIKTNSLATLWHTGPTRWLHYFSAFHSPHRVRKYVYQFLNTLPSFSQDSRIITHDEKGNPMPPIMCDWLAGKYSSDELLSIIDRALDFDIYCTSNAKRELIRTITHTMFTPRKFIKTRSFIAEGIQFIKDCKNNGHSVYILSNWDKESFTLMKDKYPDVFDLFDGIIISGEVGYNKPDPRIYQYLLETYNLDPRDCFFIDDQSINIQEACNLNINGIICPQNHGFLSSKPDFNVVRKQLDHLLR